MNVVIVGCGRLGSSLAYRVYLAGHQVAVIDQNAEAFLNLPSDFSGRLHEGDALSQEVLVRAGIEQADALAVVTNSDALNAVVGHVGRVVFNIPTVITRNYDPNFRPLFEEFNLQVVSSANWGAQRIEELLYVSQMHTVFSLGNGEVEIYEFNVPKDWLGKSVSQVTVGKDCVLLSVTHAGRAIPAQGDYVFQESDVVHVSGTFEGTRELRSCFSEVNKAEG